MGQTLRVLLVEDNATDAELLLRELRRADFEPEWTRVETEQDYLASLDPSLDIILSDYSMPQFSGLRALELLKARDLEIPFILVSATIGEETAVGAMRSGAADYLLKDRLTRLGQAVHHALEQSRLRKEREKAVQAMEQSEHKYRHLFESLSEAAFVIDKKSRRILDANLCAEKLLGRNRSEILGMDETALYPSNTKAEWFAANDRDPEAEVRSKSGTVIPVRLSQAPIELYGRELVLVLMADITARKQVEQRLREQAQMLDQAHDAIIVTDFADQRIIFWNSGAQRLYGWKDSEAMGHSVASLILVNPQDLETISSALLATGEFRGQLKEVTKDKRELTVDVWSTLVQNSDGSPRSILSIKNDITEQKNLETQLLRAQRLENIGRLASGVAHDLNNILTPILMCAESLRGRSGSEDEEHIIDMITDSARRGGGVLKQVLTFARGIEGERVVIDPTHLLEEMADIAGKTIPKSIEIQARYPNDLWSIEGDPTQLHQVLLNLSVNARDAMPNGGSLTFSADNFTVDEQYAATTPGAHPGSYVILSVADSGSGMSRETIDKIFDPFFTTKELGKGTGLGLSTSLGIVKSHGGFIAVQSELGQGTTFRIFLPGVACDAESPDVPIAATSIRGNGEQILVVDDEPNILAITRAIFERHNYHVITASDGPEALALFAQQMPYISGVLTDLAMPYMDGVALVRALKRLKSSIPIVASTGQGDQAGVAELQSLGVKHFLTKPYNTEKLLATLHDTLQTTNGAVGAASADLGAALAQSPIR